MRALHGALTAVRSGTHLARDLALCPAASFPGEVWAKMAEPYISDAASAAYTPT